MPAILKRVPPSLIALSIQFLSVLLVVAWTKFADWQGSWLDAGVLCGLCAMLFSYVCGLAKWWLPIQAGFIPAVLLMLSAEFPPLVFLIGFLVLLLVYWSTFRSQVPLYLSSHKVWQSLAQYLSRQGPGEHSTFIDLGSGLGGVLTYLAEVRPAGSYVGVEAAPLPFCWSWLRIRRARYRNCRVLWGSLWDCDLSQYDVVFAYLSPVPMERLWLKARAEMRPGALFISNTFVVLDCPPHETIKVDDLHRSTLFIWKM